MVKNRHLLATVTGLAGLSALLGVWLAIAESRNARQLGTLEAEFTDARRKWEASDRELTQKYAQVSSDLTSTRDRLNAAVADGEKSRVDLSAKLAAVSKSSSKTDADLNSVRKTLGDVQSKLGIVLRSRWLADNGNPTDEKMKEFDRLVAELVALLGKKK
ncbi:MAG: hypothetical protein EXS09_20810 [Gemmataceae bacterium]|nr:hypothetical protein [Gemmataceae bacterium]